MTTSVFCILIDWDGTKMSCMILFSIHEVINNIFIKKWKIQNLFQLPIIFCKKQLNSEKTYSNSKGMQIKEDCTMAQPFCFFYIFFQKKYIQHKFDQTYRYSNFSKLFQELSNTDIHISIKFHLNEKKMLKYAKSQFKHTIILAFSVETSFKNQSRRIEPKYPSQCFFKGVKVRLNPMGGYSSSAVAN